MTNDPRREAVAQIRNTWADRLMAVRADNSDAYREDCLYEAIDEAYDAGAAHERARWDGQPVIDRANAAEQALAEVRAWRDECRRTVGGMSDPGASRKLDAILAKLDSGEPLADAEVLEALDEAMQALAEARKGDDDDKDDKDDKDKELVDSIATLVDSIATLVDSIATLADSIATLADSHRHAGGLPSPRWRRPFAASSSGWTMTTWAKTGGRRCEKSYRLWARTRQQSRW